MIREDREMENSLTRTIKILKGVV